MIGGFAVQEVDTGDTRVLLKDREQAEWITSELNTLDWAVQTLLRKIPDNPRDLDHPELKRAGQAASVEPLAQIPPNAGE